jgi:hypothetical protein
LKTGSGSGQAEVGNPEVGQRYRTAGRLSVRGMQSGQAGELMVRIAKGQNQEDEKRETGEKQELIEKPLIDLSNKTNWQQTNREHRYKYTGEKWVRWATPGGAWRQSQGQVNRSGRDMFKM